MAPQTKLAKATVNRAGWLAMGTGAVVVWPIISEAIPIQAWRAT